jgi:hypothetical protein
MHRVIGNKENRTMMYKFALAASALMLATISPPVFAKSAAPSDRHAVYAFNASDEAVATEPNATNAYRYHGGPKAND